MKYDIDWKNPATGESGTFKNIEIPQPGIPDLATYQQKIYNIPIDVLAVRVVGSAVPVITTASSSGQATTTTGTIVPAAATPADIIGTHDLILRRADGDEAVTRSQQELERLLDAGYKVVREDGSLANWQPFRGGKVIDSHPLNVILGRGWMPGQQEAIAEALASGELIAEPTIDLTKRFSSGMGMTLAIGTGVAILAFNAFGKKKGRRQ